MFEPPSHPAYTKAMNRLLPFQEISSVDSIAEDFNALLALEGNDDIRRDFPATVNRYGNGVEHAVESFEKTRELMRIGGREQFIVMAGARAVGLCLISTQIEQPPGLDTTWPNISGFVMNPFRGQGIGRFSIEERMKVVEQHFDNHAWTFVRDGNAPSEHLVLDVGFQKTDQQVDGWEGHHLYIFDGR
jgi:predicted acetyltransferase